MVTTTNLRSGSVARATGVSADTIRYYERIGVLPRALRTKAGYRSYPETAVERVRVVQRALRIGFTLAELAEVLKARDRGGAPCRRVFELAQEKLKAIRANIEAMQRTEKYLQHVLSDWKKRMRRSAPGGRSHLLHSLTRAIDESGERPNNFRRKKK